MFESCIIKGSAPKSEFAVDLNPSRQSVGEKNLIDFGTSNLTFDIEQKNATISAGVGIIEVDGEHYFNPLGEVGLTASDGRKLGFFDKSSILTVEYMVRSTDQAIARTFYSTGSYPSGGDVRSGHLLVIDRQTNLQSDWTNITAAKPANNSKYYRLTAGASDPRKVNTLRRYQVIYDKAQSRVKFRDDLAGTESAWSAVGNVEESYFRMFAAHNSPKGTDCPGFLFKRLTLQHV